MGCRAERRKEVESRMGMPQGAISDRCAWTFQKRVDHEWETLLSFDEAFCEDALRAVGRAMV
jgi:hypothetical protein